MICKNKSAAEIKFSMLFLSSIIFLWDIQIRLLVATVPSYLLLLAFPGVFVIKLRIREILLTFFLFIYLIYFTFLQKLQGVHIVKPSRTFVGLLIFSILVVLVRKYLLLLFRSEYAKRIFFKYIKYFLYLQFTTQIIQLVLSKLGFFHSGYPYVWKLQRVPGLFAEPSHLVISLTPLLFLYLYNKNFFYRYLGKKTFYILIFSLLLSPSSTLVVLLLFAIIFLFFQRVTIKNIIFGIIIFIIAIIAIFKIPAVKERFFSLLYGLYNAEISDSNLKNLSALIFLKGLEMAKYALKHFPLGVGFLNLEFLNDYVVVSHLNKILYDLNANDGSSIAFKIIGEFGYIGLLFLFTAVIYFLSLLKRYNKINIMKIFFLFGFISCFVRGTSYFDGYPIFALAILFNRYLRYFFIFESCKFRNIDYIYHL